MKSLKIFIFLFHFSSFPITYSQNIVYNAGFEEIKRAYVKYSGLKILDTLFMIDSFITHWKPLYHSPQYHNISVPSQFAIDTNLNNGGYEPIPNPFQGNGLIWLNAFHRSKDKSEFKPILNQITFYGDTDLFSTSNHSGFYQKMKHVLIKDSTYTVSYRLKSGSELKTYGRNYDNFANIFGVLFTTTDISRPTRFKISYYKPELQDTILDTTYNWRLIQNEFIADSAYQFINFAQFMDIRKMKYKVNKPTLHYLGGDTSYTVTYPFLVDDVRLLPKWQYLKTKDIEACENDSIELKVISGVGPYSWIEYNKNIVLSNQEKIKIKVSDTNVKYQVMSPYDTAIVQVKVTKKQYKSDTINIKKCNNESLIINDSNIIKWYDNQTDTYRVFNQSSQIWYETFEKCITKKIHINLEIGNATYDTLNVNTCKEFYFQNNVYTKSGIYTIKFQNINSCDSFVTLNLNTKGVSAAVEVNNQREFKAKVPNLRYQWYLCEPYWRKIENAINQSLITTTQSSFAVIVEDSSGQCRDTSQCVDKYYLSIHGNTSSNLTIYPNPFTDKIHIENPKSEKFSAQLTDLQGKTIAKSQTISSKSYTLEFDKNLPKGLYFLEIKTESETSFHKILKVE